MSGVLSTQDSPHSAPVYSVPNPRPRRVNFFSNRAFAAFTVALAASMWALFTDIGRPYLPSVPIVVYTLYLYANRTSVGQLGGDALKDSPYFLGFLLTMFALFKIFNDVSFSSTLFGQNPALMTQEVGGAVLTTIVGLFCRQALLALVQDEAPEEDDRLAALANAVTSHAVAFEVARQQFFREMAEERARQTEELKHTQSRFLAELNAASNRVPQAAPPPSYTSSYMPTSITPTSVTPVAPTAAVTPTSNPVVSRPTMAEQAVNAVVEANPSHTVDAPRTQPYAGPSAASANPTPSAATTPQGTVPAVGAPKSDQAAQGPGTSGAAGSSGATPPYPPYFGQGRASNTTRSEE